MSVLRYLCTKTNEYSGRWYTKGMLYEFASTPPTAYFEVTTADPKTRANVYGAKDIDETYYFGENVKGYDDLRFPLFAQELDSPAGGVSYNYTECTADFKTSADYPDDPVCIVAQMQHSKKLGSIVYPHLHWIQSEGNIPNWLMRYRWYNNGAAVPAFTNAAYTYSAFLYASGDILQITGFPPLVPPDSETVSSILDIILFRDSDNDSLLFADADPYTVVAQAKEFDLHFISDSLGSGRETKK